jgi:hypothetical protein
MPACFPAPEIVEEEPSNVPELSCDNLEEVRANISVNSRYNILMIDVQIHSLLV